MLLLPNVYIILYTWDQTRVLTCQQNLMGKGDGFVEGLETLPTSLHLSWFHVLHVPAWLCLCSLRCRYLNELCRFSDTSDDDNTRDRFFLLFLFFFSFSLSVYFVIGLLLRVCKTNTNAMAEI